MTKKSTKRYLATAILSVVLLLGAVVPPATVWADGEVTVATTATTGLTIATVSELKEFASKVNAGNSYSGQTVKLANDIAFDGVTINNYTPIEGFAGTFDGCGYTISGINVTNGAYAGLFASVKGGTVKNVTVKNSSFIGSKGLPAGGIVAWLWSGGSIINCHVVDSTISSKDYYAGGVAGNVDDGTVVNCSSNSSVTSDESIGGIVGDLGKKGTIANSCNTGAVTSSGIAASVGGICGIIGGTVQNCFNAGTVTGATQKTVKIGGIAGWVLYGTVANCYTAEESAESQFGATDGTELNCTTYPDSEMKTDTFLAVLNANRGGNKGWFLWEFREDSAYPLTVKLVRLANCNVALAEGSYIYDGQAKTPAVSAVYGNDTLVKDEDYTVSYLENVDAGTATAVIAGTGRYTGETSITFTINKAEPTFAYQKSITKTYGAGSFILGTRLQAGDGTLEYKTSNSKVVKVDATGKITITGTGRAVITVTCAPTKNYNEGSITTTITVKPKKPSVSLISKGNKMTVKWKKVSKATGYKIQYANNKKFTKNCKNKTIQKNTFTIGGLKAKNTYYVRVCAYKTITVNGKKTTITGPWSKVKKITG